MDAIFLKIVNMSITASWLVLAVILLRILLKKAPKWIMGILWGFVAIRLICPFSIESMFSLIPSSETIPNDILTTQTPAINSGLSYFNQAVNPIINGSLAPNVGDSVNPVQVITFIATIIWLIGVLAMFLYTIVSFICIKRKVGEAVLVKENIWICDRISTPFILGVIKPRIYLPSSMSEADAEYVISHEKAHLKRHDHIWKPFGFLILSVYWFNPILWVAYMLLCKDIELACDEKVIKELGNEMKKPYSEALINCSIPRKMIAACPLAFGEVGVKVRVKSVLNYKKPAFWIMLVAIIAVVVTAVCLLTKPKSYDVSDLDAPLQVFLDMQIAEHHESEHTKDNFIVIDYELISETTVYMWVLYMEYSCENGELQKESGAHTPTVVTAKKDGNHYELVEYWTPRDGSYYESDIKDKFPMYLWSQAIDSQRFIDEQQARCEQSAREYFGISESTVGGVSGPESVTTIDQNKLDTATAEAPKLTIVYGESAYQAMMGTHSWTVKKDDGTLEAIAADGMHPLQVKDYMPELKFFISQISHIDPLTAYLSFENIPVEVTARGWKESDWGNVNAKSKTIEVALLSEQYDGIQFALELEEEPYIYEITATWSYKDGTGGTVTYCFYTAESIPVVYEPNAVIENIEGEGIVTAVTKEETIFYKDKNLKNEVFMIPADKAVIVLRTDDTNGSAEIQYGENTGWVQGSKLRLGE